ncbi:hypothetical protein SOM11_04205 [Frigoribacterium sp. CFBP9039]|uniref:hypothetical protein n=1 Tax=Frigoribacterium TaxID=96492 RepID=UPI00177F0766|nr:MULTISPECIES: hypothetical protein [Frigoribacterium]MBD8703633.1 hypothetical protein [Frigoribacterium sp. CFBP 13712]MCJ0702089.1 hypothetical protein [Frigoribacterium faeni]MDY0890857.1 hypothetical protein [Frigoribacterium sp. CFBP9030]MDY0945183.1 hypothetical protein [Frigoribacterium sp. CFBP9039]
MENRFRIDDDDLGVDLQASSVTLDDDGVIDAVVVAQRVPAAADWTESPPRLRFRDVPLKFDGASFGATVDDDLLDEHDIAFWLEGSDDVHGVLSLRAGDLLRFVGTTHVSGEPTSWRLDVALAFGGTRRAPAV